MHFYNCELFLKNICLFVLISSLLSLVYNILRQHVLYYTNVPFWIGIFSENWSVLHTIKLYHGGLMRKKEKSIWNCVFQFIVYINPVFTFFFRKTSGFSVFSFLSLFSVFFQRKFSFLFSCSMHNVHLLLQTNPETCPKYLFAYEKLYWVWAKNLKNIRAEGRFETMKRMKNKKNTSYFISIAAAFGLHNFRLQHTIE